MEMEKGEERMKEADILATTYTHTCTVIRPTPTVVNGFDDYEEVEVYQGVPCAVSFSQLPNDGQSDTTQSIDYVATLFLRPEFVIDAGDIVKADVEGQKYEFITNEAARYSSHLEVPLIRSDRA